MMVDHFAACLATAFGKNGLLCPLLHPLAAWLDDNHLRQAEDQCLGTAQVGAPKIDMLVSN